MKILVTGWAGFIGSHLVDALLARGDVVYVIDNLSTGSLQNIAHCQMQQGFHFIRADVCNKSEIENVFAEILPDLVYHLAAQVNVRKSIKKPEIDIDVNIKGTLYILDAMKNVGCSRIIFASTGGMFNHDSLPYAESSLTHPENPYSISKMTAELLLDFYYKQYWISFTILRYANVYWIRQNIHWEAGVISIFIDKALRRETPNIYWNGEQTRDFISVFDIVSANLHVLNQNLVGIYHAGTGKETSVNQLWKIISHTTNTDISANYLDAVGEIQRSALDSTKLISTGWKPIVTLEQGIQDLITSMIS